MDSYSLEYIIKKTARGIAQFILDLFFNEPN